MSRLSAVTAVGYLVCSYLAAAPLHEAIAPHFEENAGQAPSDVRFLVRAPGYAALFDGKAEVRYAGAAAGSGAGLTRMHLLGGAEAPQLAGAGGSAAPTTLYGGTFGARGPSCTTTRLSGTTAYIPASIGYGIFARARWNFNSSWLPAPIPAESASRHGYPSPAAGSGRKSGDRRACRSALSRPEAWQQWRRPDSCPGGLPGRGGRRSVRCRPARPQIGLSHRPRRPIL